ncbi:AsmA family protein [Muricoccus radiodurans]|uniref:AsmA family protein n=1 Tax=Muricoccus radiodurans TaxID=2231721 RepID=UPI003CF8A1C6
MAQRRVPPWLWWVGTPVVLIALVIAFWNWNWLIPIAERQASAALGRPVKIERLHVRLGRPTTITVEGLRVGEPEGFPDPPPFASVPRLTAQVDLVAYWRTGRVVLPSLEVERPVVEVIARPDGSNNFTFGTREVQEAADAVVAQAAGQRPPAPPPEALAQGAAAEGDAPFSLGRLRIVDGRVHTVMPGPGLDVNIRLATVDDTGGGTVSPELRLAVGAEGTLLGRRVTVERGDASLGTLAALLAGRAPPGQRAELNVQGVRVGNPEGFGDDPPFATLDRLRVEVDFAALRNEGRIVLPVVEIDRPVVEAIARPDGTNNFTFAHPAAQEVASAAAARAGAVVQATVPSGEPAFTVGQVQVREGRVHAVLPAQGADLILRIGTADNAGSDLRLALAAEGTLFRRQVAIEKVDASLGTLGSLLSGRGEAGAPASITAEGVRVGNPEGFGDDLPLARVERVRAEFDLAALRNEGRVVIPVLEVRRPQLEVIQRPDGTNNYSFDLGADAPAAPAGEGAAPATPPPDAGGPVVRLLRIADGEAHVVLPSLKADFNLRVGTRDEDGPEPRVVAQVAGTYDGQRITGTVTGGALLALNETGRPWPIEANLANGQTRITLRGTLSNPLQLAGADVRLDLRGPDMAQLEPLTGVPFPSTPNYQIAGRLDYAEGRVRFREFQGRVGSSDLAGTITVTTGQGKPEVVAELRSRRVDLADLGGFIGEEPGRQATPGQTAGQRAAQVRNQTSSRVLPDSPINFPKLDAANVRLSYRADSIVGRNIPFDGMRAEMEVRDGAVTLRPVAFRVGRGQIEGNIQLTPARNGQLHAVADVQFQRLDVSRLMQATGAFEGSGILGGRARIDGTGNSFAGILGSANGALTLTMMGDGTLSALLVDLSGLRIGNAILSAIGVPGRTAVQCFIGDFALTRGVLNSRAIVLDTEDVLTLGAGAVDLGREIIGIRLRSHSKSFTVGALPTSILIDGTFRDPNVAPELDELLARGGAAAGIAALLAPVAGLLPTIQLGIGEDDRCERMVRGGGRAQRPQR